MPRRAATLPALSGRQRRMAATRPSFSGLFGGFAAGAVSTPPGHEGRAAGKSASAAGQPTLIDVDAPFELALQTPALSPIAPDPVQAVMISSLFPGHAIGPTGIGGTTGDCVPQNVRHRKPRKPRKPRDRSGMSGRRRQRDLTDQSVKDIAQVDEAVMTMGASVGDEPRQQALGGGGDDRGGAIDLDDSSSAESAGEEEGTATRGIVDKSGGDSGAASKGVLAVEASCEGGGDPKAGSLSQEGRGDSVMAVLQDPEAPGEQPQLPTVTLPLPPLAACSAPLTSAVDLTETLPLQPPPAPPSDAMPQASNTSLASTPRRLPLLSLQPPPTPPPTVTGQSTASDASKDPRGNVLSPPRRTSAQDEAAQLGLSPGELARQRHRMWMLEYSRSSPGGSGGAGADTTPHSPRPHGTSRSPVRAGGSHHPTGMPPPPQQQQQRAYAVPSSIAGSSTLRAGSLSRLAQLNKSLLRARAAASATATATQGPAKAIRKKGVSTPTGGVALIGDDEASPARDGGGPGACISVDDDSDTESKAAVPEAGGPGAGALAIPPIYSAVRPASPSAEAVQASKIAPHDARESGGDTGSETGATNARRRLRRRVACGHPIMSDAGCSDRGNIGDGTDSTAGKSAALIGDVVRANTQGVDSDQRLQGNGERAFDDGDKCDGSVSVVPYDALDGDGDDDDADSDYLLGTLSGRCRRPRRARGNDVGISAGQYPASGPPAATAAVGRASRSQRRRRRAGREPMSTSLRPASSGVAPSKSSSAACSTQQGGTVPLAVEVEAPTAVPAEIVDLDGPSAGDNVAGGANATGNDSTSGCENASPDVAGGESASTHISTANVGGPADPPKIASEAPKGGNADDDIVLVGSTPPLKRSHAAAATGATPSLRLSASSSVGQASQMSTSPSRLMRPPPATKGRR